jgi:hydroxymethylpyrimidine/phosphomethylpyrimidine kinase
LRNRGIAGKTTDVLVIGPRSLHFSAPRVAAAVHGTGCVLASLIAGRLAATHTKSGDRVIVDAIRWAESTLHQALERPVRIGAGLLVLPL